MSAWVKRGDIRLNARTLLSNDVQRERVDEAAEERTRQHVIDEAYAEETEQEHQKTHLSRSAHQIGRGRTISERK